MDRLPYLPACASHSTPWSSGPLAARLAHSSATSFPGIPLCAGHQRISISTVGSRSHRAAVAFLVWRAQVWPGRTGLVVRHPRNRGLSISEDADSAELSSLSLFRCLIRARAMAAHSAS